MNASRRQIIAAGVPVVVTLGCGRAMAQASSLRCIDEIAATPPVCVDTDMPDNYLREFSDDCPDGQEPELKAKLIYVDQDGNEVAQGGVPVTLSCYASFVPIA